MVKVDLELEGDPEEVLGILRQICVASPGANQGPSGSQIAPPDRHPADPATSEVAVAEPETAATPAELPPGRWTEALAADFMARLEPVGRRTALQVWRAAAAGIHRSVLCRRTDLTPVELRVLLIRMGHALRRFQREHGVTLSRPVAANAPLQSYFIDPDFAAVAALCMFGDEA